MYCLSSVLPLFSAPLPLSKYKKWHMQKVIVLSWLFPLAHSPWLGNLYGSLFILTLSITDTLTIRTSLQQLGLNGHCCLLEMRLLLVFSSVFIDACVQIYDLWLYYTADPDPGVLCCWVWTVLCHRLSKNVGRSIPWWISKLVLLDHKEKHYYYYY